MAPMALGAAFGAMALGALDVALLLVALSWPRKSENFR
jgi:hypothetical protein